VTEEHQLAGSDGTEPVRTPTPGDLMARRPVNGPPPAAAIAQEPAEEQAEEPAEEPAGRHDAPPAGGGTGDDRVDAALRRLDAVDELPVSDHVAQYDAVHRTLQDALAAIDEG